MRNSHIVSYSSSTSSFDKSDGSYEESPMYVDESASQDASNAAAENEEYCNAALRHEASSYDLQCLAISFECEDVPSMDTRGSIDYDEFTVSAPGFSTFLKEPSNGAALKIFQRKLHLRQNNVLKIIVGSFGGFTLQLQVRVSREVQPYKDVFGKHLPGALQQLNQV